MLKHAIYAPLSLPTVCIVTGKKIWYRPIFSSIKPKFDNEFLTCFFLHFTFTTRTELWMYNCFCFDLHNWQNNFNFSTCTKHVKWTKITVFKWIFIPLWWQHKGMKLKDDIYSEMISPHYVFLKTILCNATYILVSFLKRSFNSHTQKKSSYTTINLF